MVFRQMKRSPRLDHEAHGLSVRGLREFHATDDKHRFEFTSTGSGMIPVFKGDSFNLWSPETGSVYAYADPETILEALQTGSSQMRV